MAGSMEKVVVEGGGAIKKGNSKSRKVRGAGGGGERLNSILSSPNDNGPSATAPRGGKR